MRYKPTKTQKLEFALKMQEIEKFCQENNIIKSFSSDNYYFSLNGKNYRVSNHAVEKSNAKAYDENVDKIRELYHPLEREKETIYITASKTRIIEIYNNLKAGFELNKRGQKKL